MKKIALFFIALTLPFSAFAAEGGDSEKARQFVDSVAGDVMDILHSTKSEAAKRKELEHMIVSHVDIEWIGKFVLGRYWRQASDTQKTTYIKNYRDFIATTYASRFIEYQGEGFEISGIRAENNNRFTVKMKVKTDKEPILIDYIVHQDSGKYKIVDLVVEGVSMITTQRSEFASIVQGNGLDYLIAQLGDKTSSLKMSQNDHK